MRRRLATLIKVLWGIFLYIVSPNFRATVAAHTRGADDRAATGEQVIAIIQGPNGHNQTIAEGSK